MKNFWVIVLGVLVIIIWAVALFGCPQMDNFTDKPIPRPGNHIRDWWGEPRLVESNSEYDKYIVYTRWDNGKPFSMPYWITTKHGDEEIISIWTKY